MQRREFITSTALTAAAVMLPQTNFSQSNNPLKKAVLISMLPKTMSYLDRFKLAIDCGFEAMEAQTITDQKEAEQIKEAADKAKLRIHSVMNMAHWANPLSSSDAGKVATSMQGMETSLRNAKLWGADTVLLVPAVVDATTTIPQAWQRSVPQIKKLIPLAKELNVVIAIEEVWNKFLLTPYELARYVDEFKSPWVKAYFDIGNIVMYGFPQEWIRALGKRIVKFHLKDFDTKTRNFVNLREGSIDWPAVRKAIGDIGYNGYLTVELSGGDAAYLQDVSRRVDKIFAGE